MCFKLVRKLTVVLRPVVLYFVDILKHLLTENQKMLEEKFADIKEAEDNHEKDLVEMEKINQEVVTSLQEKIKLLEKNLQNFTDVEQELVINACFCGMI